MSGKVYDADIETLLGPSKDMALGGGYEAASRFSRELGLYQPPVQSANLDMLPDKELADGRGRDMVRNDAYVQTGSALQKDSIVGSAFLLNAKPEISHLRRQDSRLDETWEEEFQEEVETSFNLYAESPIECYADAGGSMTLTEMVRLMVGVAVYGGEGLAVVEWDRYDRSRPFQTMIQCVEVDRLSTPYDQVGDRNVVAGVRQEPRTGKPVGYYIRKGHPTDYLNPDAWFHQYVPARLPWGRAQVIHLREQIRPAQTRAVAEIAAAMGEMRTTKQFRRVTMQNAILNASYAASIESELPTEMIMAQLGANQTDPGDATLAWAGKYLAAIGAYGAGGNNLHIDGAKLPHFFPGTKLTMRPMGTPGGIGTEFEASLLRYIAASLGVSYEQLSRDYSRSNYSSIRAAMTETWKFMQAKKKIIADRFASHVYRLWLEEALNKGLIYSMPRNIASTANFYEGLNRQAYSSCEWIGAGRGQIDELKETQAAALRIKMNLTTLEYEHARFGHDWRKQLRQKRREQAILKEYDLLPPEDNAMNAASGTPRERSVEEADTGEDA